MNVTRLFAAAAFTWSKYAASYGRPTMRSGVSASTASTSGSTPLCGSSRPTKSAYPSGRPVTPSISAGFTPPSSTVRGCGQPVKNCAA